MGSIIGIGGHWLAQCAMLLFLVFAVAGFAVGAGLLASTEKTIALFHRVNRWVSTRHALKAVEVPRDTEHVSHKYQRWVAGGFVIGGLVSVVGLIDGVDVAATSAAITKSSVAPAVAIALNATKWFLVLGSAFGVVVGGMLLFYPNAEATLEKFANRWVSSRRVVRNWDDMHMTLDRLVEAHPRPAGWVIALTSAAAVIYAVVTLLRWY